MAAKTPTTQTQIRAANGALYALTMSPEQAAALLGLGRSTAYEMVQDGTWPTPLTPAGRTLRKILTVPLLSYAGMTYEFVAQTPPPEVTSPVTRVHPKPGPTP